MALRDGGPRGRPPRFPLLTRPRAPWSHARPRLMLPRSPMPARRPSAPTAPRSANELWGSWLVPLAISWAMAASSHAQAPAFLVRDINSVPEAVASDPRLLVQVGATIYFVASTPQMGRELWKSDGTAAGTALVTAIRPGGECSSPDSLVGVGGTLFFTASDGSTGSELWKSDGSAAGTVRVKDIWPGSIGSSPSSLVDVDGTLYFAARDDV